MGREIYCVLSDENIVCVVNDNRWTELAGVNHLQGSSEQTGRLGVHVK